MELIESDKSVYKNAQRLRQERFNQQEIQAYLEAQEVRFKNSPDALSCVKRLLAKFEVSTKNLELNLEQLCLEKEALKEDACILKEKTKHIHYRA